MADESDIRTTPTGQSTDSMTRDLTTAPMGTGSPSLSTLPERVGRYILGPLIDGGGMGRVFRATHEETHAEAAIKIMRTDLASEGAVERFRQESRLLARVRHPNIAQVYDAGTTTIGEVETPYIAMEYIPDARTIREYARSHTVEEMLRLFVKVCRAVDHANDRGIVHRDLKPSNILVDAYGEPKVIDFGVAKNLDQRFEEGSFVTQEGSVPGTLPYMAPEQVLPRGDLIDRRTDVYALGVVLYELICGRLPYRVSGVPLPEAVRVICEQDPTEPTYETTRESLSRDLRTVLLKMLSKERARRYDSADEVAGEIERILAGTSIHASPASSWYRARVWLGRAGKANPLVVAAAIWLISVLLTMTFGSQIVYRISGLAGKYASLVLSTIPPMGAGAQQVVVFGIEDIEGTANLVESVDLAPREQDLHPATRGRPLIGAFLTRLSECEPRAVAVDFRFNAPNRAQFIVEGIESLRSKGIETVVGSTSFLPVGYGTEASSGLGDIDPSIARVARWGAVDVSFNEGWAVRLALGVKHTGDVFPSFGLASLVASRSPGQDYVISIEDGFLRVSYLVSEPGKPIRRSGQGFNVPYTEAAPHPRLVPNKGISPGDIVVNAAAPIPQWVIDQSEPSTIRMKKALTMPIDQLRNLVTDKVIVIIDLRPGFDEGTLKGGQTFHKGYLWASWLDRELSGQTIRGPGKSPVFLQIVCGGLIGALFFTFPPNKRRIWAPVAALGVAAFALLGGFLAFEVASILYIPLLGVAALLISGLISTFYPRAIEL